MLWFYCLKVFFGCFHGLIDFVEPPINSHFLKNHPVLELTKNPFEWSRTFIYEWNWLYYAPTQRKIIKK